MKKLIFFILMFLFAYSAFADEFSPIKLFHIERSKNKNQVHYFAMVDKNCKLKEIETIKGQWLVLEKDKDHKEELSTFDQIAYGIIKPEVKDNWVTFSLRALKQRIIKATAEKKDDKCITKSIMQISGQDAFFEKVYVFSKEGFVMPTVIYLDIYGKLPDGKPIIEKFKP